MEKVKEREMCGHAEEMRNAHRFLTGKHFLKNWIFARPQAQTKDDIKIMFKIQEGGWLHLASKTVQWLTAVNTAMGFFSRISLLHGDSDFL